jgi:hypothetical protein
MGGDFEEVFFWAAILGIVMVLLFPLIANWFGL